MKARVTYYKPNQGGGVMAYLGLYIEDYDLYLSKLRLIRTRHGGYFIAPPSDKFTTPEGTSQYANHFWFGKTNAKPFQQAASLAIQEYAKSADLERSSFMPLPEGATAIDHTAAATAAEPASFIEVQTTLNL